MHFAIFCICLCFCLFIGLFSKCGFSGSDTSVRFALIQISLYITDISLYQRYIPISPISLYHRYPHITDIPISPFVAKNHLVYLFVLKFLSDFYHLCLYLPKEKVYKLRLQQLDYFTQTPATKLPKIARRLRNLRSCK